MSETGDKAIILRADRLSKTYLLGKTVVPVLKDIRLEVQTGETVAIVGASGAGKSTLLHILGGLDSPSGGGVLFQECDLYNMSARQRTAVRARKIGFVFQFYHLLPELDVLDNVLLPTMNRASDPFRAGCSWLTHAVPSRAAAARTRARDLLQAVGLGHRADHLPMELSGGEQQRVALVRALMNQPDLLLADEPTGNLDSVTGAQVLDALFALTRQAGHTLIMVTHNQSVARRCTRILELIDGRLVAL
ncbi:MAG: ABC transporter ATP-binding protein [Verrucomicrobia bacterium]|nr:ABC transporter ATP-binding protein [Verrucomicrobiota bacterium]MBU4291883.1 ABC transporter ATP-binding protein [Verrucomicrobiota bacterium]MBU4429816.1 ABC transporter ATP-binding protein [Verrucomicrobiota bacterium]MCG2680277.1 ABC transporter ATP-binding protein [Kiritimatiellia bacterium]